ncbi:MULTISPECIES: hypothetical protein [Isoptericola]|uniref:hypothetical protein n=1 Tax=Isoptericola TaxID=254250 RepID=UPI00383AAF9C
MRITLDGVRVDGRRDPLLTELDLVWSTREAVLVAAEPGHGHTALALVATGRLAPTAGRVWLDGEQDAAALRRCTAVVDVPAINEPDDTQPLGDVVGEGLALAGRRSWPGDVTRWLSEHALAGDQSRRTDQLPGLVRTTVLAALAAANPAVRFLVLTLPDRHGGDAADWWGIARTFAAAGHGVLVQCTRASARDLGVDLPPARGVDPHSPPQVVLRSTSGLAAS